MRQPLVVLCSLTELPKAGKSRLAAPDGTVVSASGSDAELVIAEVDTERVAAARAELPYLEDRRSDLA